MQRQYDVVGGAAGGGSGRWRTGGDKAEKRRMRNVRQQRRLTQSAVPPEGGEVAFADATLAPARPDATQARPGTYMLAQPHATAR